MSRSISSKKTYQAPNSSIETDMTPSWKIKEISRQSLKKRLKLKLKTNKLSSKKTEILILRRCLRMLLSSRNTKLRKKRKPETLKRPLLMLLKLTTRRLTL